MSGTTGTPQAGSTLGRALAINATVCLWFIAAPAVPGQAAQPPEPAVVKLHDVVLDWRLYEGRRLTVSGLVQCRNEFLCFFISPKYVRTEIAVDLTEIVGAPKLAIVTGCHNDPCEVTLRGQAVRGEFLSDAVVTPEPGQAAAPVPTADSQGRPPPPGQRLGARQQIARAGTIGG